MDRGRGDGEPAATGFTVPLKVEIHTGRTWAESEQINPAAQNRPPGQFLPRATIDFTASVPTTFFPADGSSAR